MRELVVKIKRVKNTYAGTPRYKVVNSNDNDLLNTFANNKIYFKHLKAGMFTIPSAGFNYAIYNGYKVKISPLDIIMKIELV